MFNKVQKTFQQFNIVDWNIHTLFDLGLLLPVGWYIKELCDPELLGKYGLESEDRETLPKKREELELEHVPKRKKKHKKDLPKCQNVKGPQKFKFFTKKNDPYKVGL